MTTKEKEKVIIMEKETMDRLDQLEYVFKLAYQAKSEGNYYGYENMIDAVNHGLQALGLNHRIARDLGWDL